MTMRGRTMHVPAVRLLDEVASSIFSVTSKSAMTPSFIGLMATMLPGVRPSISLASRADRLDAAVHLVDGDDRRLVDDDALAARVDAGVGRAEIDRQVAREQREHRTKTQRELLSERQIGEQRNQRVCPVNYRLGAAAA